MRTGIKFSSGIKAVTVYYSWCPTSLPEGRALTYGMRRSGPFKSMRFAAYRHFEKVEKVTGKVSLSHHLLEFVICKPVSDTSLASLVRETHPEGGIYSFRRSVAEIGDPQRQRIAEFAAVAERDCRGNAAQKACSKGAAEIGDPQRQRIAEFAAVVERDSRGNATQRACSKGAAEIGDPQRQRIAEFAAVAERD